MKEIGTPTRKLKGTLKLIVEEHIKQKNGHSLVMGYQLGNQKQPSTLEELMRHANGTPLIMGHQLGN